MFVSAVTLVGASLVLAEAGPPAAAAWLGLSYAQYHLGAALFLCRLGFVLWIAIALLLTVRARAAAGSGVRDVLVTFLALLGDRMRTTQGTGLVVLAVSNLPIRANGEGDPSALDVFALVHLQVASLLPAEALYAELSENEFAVALPGRDPARLVRFAAYLMRTLPAALRTDLTAKIPRVSIGLSLYVGTAEALLQSARVALAQAKAAGAPCMFEPACIFPTIVRTVLRNEVRRGLAGAQFVPYYQPIVSLRTGCLVGVEVLARWNHPHRGLVMPDHFIEAMEEQQLCGYLSRHLVRQTAEDARSWPEHWTLAFNASAGQLSEMLKLANELESLLGGLRSSRIEIEVTETALIEDVDFARDVLHAMHRRGIKVALDDFGTGYANLLHLRELPFDRIKMDRSFVQDLLFSTRTDACVRATLELARDLGATVIAEGVENALTEHKLQDLGCDFAQGYYYSKPVPAAAVPHLACASGGCSAAA